MSIRIQIKKLDLYMIRLFMAPFLIIFFSIFFVFIVQFFWSKMDELTGKNINILIILKFIYYFGISITPLVIPISILLTSIITYGYISESQELIAIKSSGISLFRVMKPLLCITFLLSVGLYFFSDFSIPEAKRKAQELGYQISIAHPSLRLKEGVFVNLFPDFFIRIGKKKNSNLLENIFIFFYGKNLAINTILAEKGVLIPNKKEEGFQIKLMKGFFYRDNPYEGKTYSYQMVYFDSFIQSFKKPLIEYKNLDYYYDDSYKTLDTKKLMEKIHFLKKENCQLYSDFKKLNYNSLFQKKKFFSKDPRIRIDLFSYIRKIILSLLINELQHQKKFLQNRKKYLAKYQFELQKKFTFPVTCIIMFLIGAPLGAIIRKGGMGLPTLIAIIIFIIYHTLLTITQNQGEKAEIWPWMGAWIPNFVFFPLSIWITYKTVMDDFYYM
ncbi:putative permease YjgP/YjgQ family [Blattabacterium sp. (Blatta orientalis) str. Tarazona]|uniref:LptF/LptG family permease n=1 Tax=Blattabacterium sp. (Blatta orientalis) TaxID=367806 RepID=UPI0002AD677E|nr:LptF/LptG family permease [Blattabacterium sp. (Blatta orientalis)]AGD98209.1 putative permease YjgP/YjgQ family [Blattabacterium sp. (Blatta orientalis) str. Tarazona]